MNPPKRISPNEITGDYILIARLLPGFETEGQSLSFTATLDIGSAKEDGMYAVASTSCYANTIDPEKVTAAWNTENMKLEADGFTKDEIDSYKKNLVSKRSVIIMKIVLILRLKLLVFIKMMNLLKKHVILLLIKLKSLITHCK